MATRYDYIKNLSLEEMAKEMLTQQLTGISAILFMQKFNKNIVEEILKAVSNKLFKQIVEYLETEID